MLGDAAGLAPGHVRAADAVQQRGLAVVDVAHDGDDGRARLEFLGFVLDIEFELLDRRVDLASPRSRFSTSNLKPYFAQTFAAMPSSMDWLTLAKTPASMRSAMTLNGFCFNWSASSRTTIGGLSVMICASAGRKGLVSAGRPGRAGAGAGAGRPCPGPPRRSNGCGRPPSRPPGCGRPGGSLTAAILSPGLGADGLTGKFDASDQVADLRRQRYHRLGRCGRNGWRLGIGGRTFPVQVGSRRDRGGVPQLPATVRLPDAVGAGSSGLVSGGGRRFYGRVDDLDGFIGHRRGLGLFLGGLGGELGGQLRVEP